MLSYALNGPQSAALSHFSKLEHVYVGVDTSGCYWPLEFTTKTVLPFFYLPALKSASVALCAVPITQAQPLTWPRSFPLATSTLTTLRLQRTFATVSTVSKLLLGCPSLVAFEYDYHYRHFASNRLNCIMLSKALAPFYVKMKHLKICVSSQMNYLGSMGASLPNFTALETLEISLGGLQGAREPAPSPYTLSAVLSLQPLSAVLPPNLQVLTIRDDYGGNYKWESDSSEYGWMFENLVEHGRRCMTVCPHLRVVYLKLLESRGYEWSEESTDNFRTFCQTMGLECGIYKLYKHEHGVKHRYKSDGLLNKAEVREKLLEVFFD